MAFEADWGASTVLEALRGTSTVWSPTIRPSATAPRRLWASGEGCRLGAANPKSEIRNPKFCGVGTFKRSTSSSRQASIRHAMARTAAAK